ncbi:MAG: hypothetical protein M3198_11685 [Actinomycetota bacterium]|nr:hypothetical protein [Actinomycetota bacterium]
MSVDRDWLVGELRASLSALASPGSEALATVPDGFAKADELAIDYGNFVSAVLGNFGDEFSTEQTAVLRRIDAMLEAMSGAENAELWTEEAVVSHPRWQEVRKAARVALNRLGWNEDAS